jgi:broad specificity phosphatase PhoE
MALQIVLVRHAKPAVDHERLLSGVEAKAALRAFWSTSEVVAEEPQRTIAEQALRTAAVVFSSPAPRARVTCALVTEKAVSEHPVFTEIDQSIVPIPAIRLRLRGWFGLSRAAWLAGFGGETAETPKQAWKRSRAAFLALQAAAYDYGFVGMVGHGTMNRCIECHARRAGWRKETSNGSGYLSTTVFVRADHGR